MASAVLYSFRRCPYAIRARLALAAAGLRPGPDLELREVSLQARPPELGEASPKATVPVLVLADGRVLQESLEIMHWALEQADPGGWWQGRSGEDRAAIEALIARNDGSFKHHLDRFRYPDRFPDPDPASHRERALAILREWNGRLQTADWLLGARESLADAALLPFVRQFQLADPAAFAASRDLQALQGWLERFLGSDALASVMAPPWGLRQPWLSPRRIYHLALAAEWRQARAEGVYRRSTRGASLEEVGFIHASEAHQVEATWRRFYADAGAVLLLTIEPTRLEEAGVELRRELVPEAGERFPHLYGPLPLQAVLHAAPYRPWT
ncbi:MAG: DUF952 domain-containing protein [Synechococcaceae cyanobacterium]|nr:DUF952 domain-containing protein [Synechococcaceae cyanobacterium]